jgi:hypothetical protein
MIELGATPPPAIGPIQGPTPAGASTDPSQAAVQGLKDILAKPNHSHIIEDIMSALPGLLSPCNDAQADKAIQDIAKLVPAELRQPLETALQRGSAALTTEAMIDNQASMAVGGGEAGQMYANKANYENSLANQYGALMFALIEQGP